jgi:diguanylate cyclase (GGDEF)-like protein/PAS domain S-box-containing protein
MTLTGRLLIVDDIANNRKTLEALLSPLGCTIALAADGPDALAQAAATPPDVVLLDVMMPGMDGFEVCRRLRADPQLADVPVILITSLDDRDSRLLGLEAGADDFVSKPFDRDELRARVRTTVRLNRYRQLLDERAKSERLIAVAPDAIFVVNAAAVIELANPASAGLLGVPDHTALVGQSLLDFVPDDERARFRALLAQALAESSQPVRLELALRRGDGTAFPAEATLADLPGQGDAAAQLIVRDISLRQRAEAAQRLTAQVFDNMTEGIVVTDAQAAIVTVNPAFTVITGFTGETISGWPLRSLYPDDEAARLDTVMADELGAGRQWRGELWSRRHDGHLFPAAVTVSTVRDGQGRLANYVIVFSDVTARKQNEERMRILAYHDHLTGLPNRALLGTLLQQAIHQAQRNGRRGAVLFLDLDHFKNVNDTQGHAGGDQLLQAAAVRLKGSLRESDTVARLGGDEFVVLLPEIAQSTDAAAVAEKLLRVLAEPFQVVGQRLFVTASLGISVFPDDALEGDDLLKNADTALYRAKEQGRNGFVFYTPEMYAAALKRMALESSLRAALEREEFIVYYQPRVALDSGRVIGMEALVRWRHPELGLVAPGHFITVAEDTGLIVPIGRWVLRQACLQNKAWQAHGFPRLRVSVNLSGRQFKQDDVVETVAAALRETGLAPEDLELELTESILFLNNGETEKKLQALRAMGVHLAIDDFGTGYSSLEYLMRLPVHRLKIDRSFIRALTSKPEDAAIARAIVAMGHSLALEVTAEGVETAEQLSVLQACGCDESQGYYFGQPVPATEFTRFL